MYLPLASERVVRGQSRPVAAGTVRGSVRIRPVEDEGFDRLLTSGYAQNGIVTGAGWKPYLPAELAARLRAVLDQSKPV
jgi:hypothetical protein